MGFEHCTKCKEYYNPCSTYDYNLSIQNFNNPFFPKDNGSISNKEKDFLNINNTNNNIQGTEEDEKEKNIKNEINENEEEKNKIENNFIDMNNENAD